MRTLLAIFAHPDDESFGPGGTLAKYASAGSVHLVCATRGGAGHSNRAESDDPENLRRQREEELRCAASVLGLADVHFLGYRDSGMDGSAANRHPGALVQADPDEVAGKVAALMDELRPQVVITFDPYGTYGHPDHVAMNRATLAAWELLPVQTRPSRLYYTAFPRTLMRWALRLMPLAGVDPEKLGRNGDINLRGILDHEMPISTRIDVRPFLPVKQRAVACHASQLSGSTSALSRLPRWMTRRWQATEWFHRARPPFHDRYEMENDLFSGIAENEEPTCGST